ncbi:MAG: NADPH-dependent FMN reductase [Janthinobacterium lividum]
MSLSTTGAGSASTADNAASASQNKRVIRIVGIGGTVRAGSSTEKALRIALAAAADEGAEVRLFAGQDIDLPMYAMERPERTDAARTLIEALRGADGIILGSPGYHGSISGLVKNALDYTEDMSKDAAPYFDGRAVGCLTTGSGWQGANSTLSALRNVVHALRGWPTPLGVALNTREPVFDQDGKCLFPAVEFQLREMAKQVVSFARQMR